LIVATPRVSLILPCRNEAQFIERCLDSIVQNDYPAEQLEILVADGLSTDGTRDRIMKFAHRHSFIRVIDNPARTTPAGLNAAIRASTGQIIVRMDAHASIEQDYLSKCVALLQSTDADNVGGIMKTLPQTPGLIGNAIALCLKHGFGVGNSAFRTHVSELTNVDTVFGGCYRRQVFERIGMFNERLVRGQDLEFNLRLKKSGGKIVISPDIVSYYYAKSDWGSFVRHSWTNGKWAILPFLYSPVIPVSIRHLVPLFFILSLIAAAGFVVRYPWGLWPFLGLASVYGLADLSASVHVAMREKNLKFAFVMPFIFATLHLSYGLGSLWGVFQSLLMFPFVRRAPS
jgi:glycosyltransferase involved in cell wall biosynthesis